MVFVEDTFHLVEYDTFEDYWRRFVVYVGVLQSPTFLAEVELAKAWAENCVQVDGLKITIVFWILSREWVESVIWTGHRVQECCERSTEHFEKWIATGITLGTAEYCVLEDVGQTCGVAGNRTKVYGENVVTVVALEVKIFRAGGGVD